MDDQIPEEEKTRRLMILQEKQRAIQIRRNSELIGTVEEVLVEGRQRVAGPVDRADLAESDAELHASAETARSLAGQVPAGAGDARGPEFAGR